MSSRTPKEELVKQLIDQPLHVLWTLVPLLIFHYVPNPFLGGVLAALAFAAPREFWDQLPIERVWDLLLDLTFFALGGLIAGWIKWLAS